MLRKLFSNIAFFTFWGFFRTGFKCRIPIFSLCPIRSTLLIFPDNYVHNGHLFAMMKLSRLNQALLFLIRIERLKLETSSNIVFTVKLLDLDKSKCCEAKNNYLFWNDPITQKKIT